MSKVRRSIVITFLAQNLATVINFGSGLVLARLLDPADIGLFSLTAVFVGVMHTFRDFGVVSYLLREKDLTPQKIRTASGLLIATSWTIAITMLLLAYPLADFYGQPPVIKIMSVLALGFFLIPFGSVTQSLLRRELEAGKLAAVTGISTVTYAIACITLAALDFKYMSMAWANLINIIVTIVALGFIRPANQPLWPSLTGWRGIAHFGGGTALSNLMTNINNALPDTLIGKRVDAHNVGLFSRANSLVDLFAQIVMPAINNNVMPVIARSHHDKQPLSGDLCKSVSYLSGIAWPVVVVTAIFASDMITVLYGDKWLACLPAVAWLCVATAVRTPFSLTTNALVAIGRPYLSMLTVGASIVLKLVIALAFGVDNLVGFAIAFTAAEVLTLPFILAVWRNQFDVRMREVWTAVWPSLLVTLLCGAVIFPFNMLAAQSPVPARLVLAAGLSTVLWLTSIFITRHPLSEELKIGVQALRAKFAPAKIGQEP